MAWILDETGDENAMPCMAAVANGISQRKTQTKARPGKAGQTIFYVLRLYVSADYNGDFAVGCDMLGPTGLYLSTRTATMANVDIVKGAWQTLRGVFTLSNSKTAQIAPFFQMPANATIGSVKLANFDLANTSPGSVEYVGATLSETIESQAQIAEDLISDNGTVVHPSSVPVNVVTQHEGSIDATNILNAVDLAQLALSAGSVNFNPDMTVVGVDGKPAGVVAAYNNSVQSDISYLDANKTVLRLTKSATEGGISWPAFRVAPGQSYTIVVRLKSNLATATGLYIRTLEYDSELPAGAKNIVYNTGVTGSVVNTRQVVLTEENVGVGTGYSDFTLTYAPTNTAKYASLTILSWTEIDELHVDQAIVTSNATQGAQMGVDITDETGAVVGEIDSLNIYAPNDNMISDSYFSDGTGKAWDLGGGSFTRSETLGENGGPCLVSTSSVIDQDILTAAILSVMIPAAAGQRIYLSYRLSVSDVSLYAKPLWAEYDENGNYLASYTGSWNFTGSIGGSFRTNYGSITISSTSACRYIRLGLRRTAGTGTLKVAWAHATKTGTEGEVIKPIQVSGSGVSFISSKYYTAWLGWYGSYSSGGDPFWPSRNQWQFSYAPVAILEDLGVRGSIELTETLKRSAHHRGHLEGSYNNIGANSVKSNPIYTIGSSYNPADASLGIMYGIGYTHGGASFVNFTYGSGWGMYVASAGVARIFLDSDNGRVVSTGDHYVGSNKVWHQGNDGSGSGLDADYLDGIGASGFIRSSGKARHNVPGLKQIGATGDESTFELFQPNAGYDAFMTFHVSGDYALHFGLDGGINDLAVGGWSMGGTHRIWHAGNDGSGSGLDADLLDGIQGSSFLRSDTAMTHVAGAKIVVQNMVDGGASRGLWMWQPNDSGWGIYMGQSGAGRALSGGTACLSVNSQTQHQIRFRVNNSGAQGFTWENSSNIALMSLVGSTGHLHIKGNSYAVLHVNTSDMTLKENAFRIEPETAWLIMRDLVAIGYNRADLKDGITYTGFPAQHAARVFRRHGVDTENCGIFNIDPNTGRWGMAYSELIAWQVAADQYRDDLLGMSSLYEIRKQQELTA